MPAPDQPQPQVLLLDIMEQQCSTTTETSEDNIAATRDAQAQSQQYSSSSAYQGQDQDQDQSNEDLELVGISASDEKLRVSSARPSTPSSAPTSPPTLAIHSPSAHSNQTLNISTLAGHHDHRQQPPVLSSGPPIRHSIASSAQSQFQFGHQELFVIAEDPPGVLINEQEDFDSDPESAFLPSFSLATSTLVRPPPSSLPSPLPSKSQSPSTIHLHPQSSVTNYSTTTNNNGKHERPTSNTTPTLSLSFRAISPHALHSNYRALDAQSQLALIFSLPWRGMSAKTPPLPAGLNVAKLGSSATHIVGRRSNNSSLHTSSLFVSALGLGIGLSVATLSCIGCFCVARLILPQFRCFVVVSRQALAKALAAGQQLLAVVLVVKEPRPPAYSPPIRQSATRHAPRSGSNNNNLGRRSGTIMDTHYSTVTTSTRRLLLTPRTPIQRSLVIHTSSVIAGHGELSQSLSSPAHPQQPNQATIDASQSTADESNHHSDDYHLPTDDSDWTVMTSPPLSNLDLNMVSQDIDNIPPMSLAFSPQWSPRRQSTFSTSATIVPQASPPRPQRASPRRDRSTSAVDKASKRFSLNFPVQPSKPARPASWYPTSVTTPQAIESPTESSFLTVLASQERRVLELRDELQRAEDRLAQLKKQWATIEYNKTQQRSQSNVQMTPVQAALSALEGTNIDQSYAGSWLQKELERRKNFNTQVRSSGRKVFSGSRHTRTLSLLSPNKFSTPEQLSKTSPKKKPAGLKIIPQSAVERSTPFFDSDKSEDVSSKDDFYAELASTPKEVILKTGKQMVGDIKDGFMTFFEDIRQATIGDEAINGAKINTETPSTTSISRPGHMTVHERRLARQNKALTATQPKAAPQAGSYFDPLLDGVQGAFWREHGLGIDVGDENSPVVNIKARRSKQGMVVAAPKALPKPAILTPQDTKDLEEEWDTWSTPAKPASSTAAASPVPTLEHLMSPSASSDSTTTQDASNPTSPDVQITPHNIPPISATFSKDFRQGSDQTKRNKRDSGVWATHLARIAPSGVASLKHTASQIMADWERGVAANSPGATTH